MGRGADEIVLCPSDACPQDSSAVAVMSSRHDATNRTPGRVPWDGPQLDWWVMSTVAREDRRPLVSRWFKRQMAARLSVVGLIVVAAVCLAFGAVGVGVGLGVLAGLGVLIYLHQRRKWAGLGRVPGAE
jgi:hypothetical protein